MFGFTVEEIKGKSRRRPLVTARQVAMYVFRELTDLSYPAIAREFGGRDHTTVIHAVEKIKALMKERRQIYDQVSELVPGSGRAADRDPIPAVLSDPRWSRRSVVHSRPQRPGENVHMAGDERVGDGGEPVENAGCTGGRAGTTGRRRHRARRLWKPGDTARRTDTPSDQPRSGVVHNPQALLTTTRSSSTRRYTEKVSNA